MSYILRRNYANKFFDRAKASPPVPGLDVYEEGEARWKPIGNVVKKATLCAIVYAGKKLEHTHVKKAKLTLENSNLASEFLNVALMDRSREYS
ncbi:hypothetical protein KIN20_027290 [Parelaphostrongylus tenuis]|uniref:Uncharacterized protein n=1 Tax=Parelaphostrongylus tenuis TaxID=148309 RepID=A0AAD5QZ58_PARTN|nr:hypothetical protein KIN20_027290 [Parelaphostrongylus tenuis]